MQPTVRIRSPLPASLRTLGPSATFADHHPIGVATTAKTPRCPSKKGLRNRWSNASTHSAPGGSPVPAPEPWLTTVAVEGRARKGCPDLAITRLDDRLGRVEGQISSSRPHLSAPRRKLALTKRRVSTMTVSLRRNYQQPEAGTDSTTRRFCDRPCGVSFEATGFASPNP